MFDKVDLNNFWENSKYALKMYVSEPIENDNELILKTEKVLGYKLPKSYIYLMQKQNGGIPYSTCCPCSEKTSWAKDHVAIDGFYGIGPKLIAATNGAREWGYPEIGIAICECPSAGHDMIFLDYRECGKDGEPKVVHVDQEYDYKITILAENFEDFISKLCSEKQFE